MKLVAKQTFRTAIIILLLLMLLLVFVLASSEFSSGNAPDETKVIGGADGHETTEPPNINLETNTPQADSESNLPTYWLDYLKEKMPSINKEVLSIGNHGDYFSFFTDYHTEKSAGYTADILDNIQNNCPIRKHFFGGDIHNSNVNSDAIKLTWQFKNTFDKLDLFTVLGNHEVNVYSEAETDPTESEIYALMFKHLEEKTKVSLDSNLYYTYDNDTQKIRYIVLNTHNAAYRATINDTAQINWFYEKLSELEDSWSVVVFMHMYYGGVSDDGVHSVSPDGEMIKNICDALNKRGTYSSANYSFNFANAKSNVIGIISGHTHRDYFEYAESGFPIIAVGCDAAKGSNQGITRSYGTTDEHKIDLFFIDTNARTIKTIRIGAGEDRTFSY